MATTKKSDKLEASGIDAKTMPRNLEAEAAVLGCIMIDDLVAGEVLPELTPEHFFSAANRAIFEAMREIQNKEVGTHTVIDILSVADKLDKQGKLDGVGNMTYLAKLTSEIPSAANIDYYMSLVERDCLLRKIIKAGADISLLGYKSENADEALDRAQQKVYEISKESEKGDLTPPREAAAEVLKYIQDIQQGKEIYRGVQSGFENLDQLIGGFKKGTYSLIAARPSVGKTAFALSIAAHAAVVQNKRVAIFNMEMTSFDLVNRILTNMSGVPYGVQQRIGAMRPSQHTDLTNAYVKLVNSQVYIDDSADNSPTKIMSKCRKLAMAKGGLDLVIVDYLGLMIASEKAESRQQEVSTMSRLMKVYSKELGVPMVVLSQLNRAGEARGGKPELTDLRESGSIEQDADIVMFLQRYDPEKLARETKGTFLPLYTEENVIELYLEKNRNGQRGMIAFKWTGELQRFEPIAVPTVIQTPPPQKMEQASEQRQQAASAPQSQVVSAAAPKPAAAVPQESAATKPTEVLDADDIFAESTGEPSPEQPNEDSFFVEAEADSGDLPF